MPQQHHSTLVMLAVAVVTLSLASCDSNDDQFRLLMETLNNEVYQKDRSEVLALYSGQERAIRHLAWYHHAEAEVILQFLNSDSVWRSNSKRRLEELYVISRELAALHHRLVEEERFELTASESERRDRLNSQFEYILGEIEATR